MPRNSSETDCDAAGGFRIKLSIRPAGSSIDGALYRALNGVPPRARARWIRDMAYLGVLASRGEVVAPAAPARIVSPPAPDSALAADQLAVRAARASKPPAHSPRRKELRKRVMQMYPNEE